MPDKKLTFQAMNGCAACKHTASNDAAGKPAAAYGKSYWCQPLGKAVDAKDGASCPRWEHAR